ncbi:DMT family transporter [Asaia sp. HN010]|uniref:DMT family transporter n=1 Tax=Asaia sp. HN010 TaxID=3081233 RepID=UPI00301B09BB
MAPFLFFAVVIFWGLTWFAITLQIGGTSADVAIFWRFLFSAGLIGIGLAITGRLRRPPASAWVWILGMGACLFSCNYLGIYTSELYLPSGTVSVVFSMATLLNTLNLWLFFRQKPDLRVLAGGLLGVCGVALLLAGGMGHGNWHHTLIGLGFALLGTFLFSCGNMFSRRMGRYTLSLTNTVFWGMLSGAVIMALFIPLGGHGYGFPLTWRWMTGLVYLILFGSIVGFLFYLELVRRIGADRAAYATILSPVIALGMSAFFEQVHWSAPMLAGLVLILLGNVLAFLRRKPLPQPVEVEQG